MLICISFFSDSADFVSNLLSVLAFTLASEMKRPLDLQTLASKHLSGVSQAYAED